MSSILHQFAFAAGIVAIRLHWLKIVKRSVAVALAGITQKLVISRSRSFWISVPLP